jgi:hypothetical protein
MLRSALRQLTGATPAQPTTPLIEARMRVPDATGGAYDTVPDTISSLRPPFYWKKAALETTAEVEKKPNFIHFIYKYPGSLGAVKQNRINNLARN